MSSTEQENVPEQKTVPEQENVPEEEKIPQPETSGAQEVRTEDVEEIVVKLG